MLPVIAIVGRPNVGKSTLFNVLTQSRNALVSDFPGMTRDRQYGQANYNGHQFIVIDTAGIGDIEKDIDKLSEQQSIQAIQEADQVLFLVDGRAGLTPADQEIAKKLRGLNKKVTLVVNKSEGRDPDIVTAEFFKLGFDEPFAIAAAHGYGVKELINKVFAAITSSEEEIENNKGIRLAIIGRPNVGKSTLTNRMLGEERVIVYDLPGTTRDSIFIPLERMGKNYTLIDTAGIRRRGKIFEATEKFSVVKTLQAIETAQVVLFIIDAREGVTDQDLRLLGFILDSGKALVIAINKWDDMSQYERDNTKASIDRKINFLDFARIHFISALHGTGVGNLFKSVDEAFASATKKISTPQINKILQQAIESHNPPLIKGRRVKLRYGHLGGNNPPIVVIHGNQVQELPEAYKRYLSHTFQSKLKLVGTPVKIEFKNSANPFKGRKNILTDAQLRKKKRLLRHVKK